MTERVATFDPSAFFIDGKQQGSTFLVIVAKRNMHQPHGQSAPSFAFEKDAALFIHPHERRKFLARHIFGIAACSAQRKGSVRGADTPFRPDADRHKPRHCHCPPDAPGYQLRRPRFDIEPLDRFQPPQQIFIPRPGPRDAHAVLRRAFFDRIDMARAVTPCGASGGEQKRLTVVFNPQIGRRFQSWERFGKSIVSANQSSGTVADGDRGVAKLRCGMGNRPVGRRCLQHLVDGFRPANIVHHAPHSDHCPGTTSHQHQIACREPQDHQRQQRRASQHQHVFDIRPNRFVAVLPENL